MVWTPSPWKCAVKPRPADREGCSEFDGLSFQTFSKTEAWQMVRIVEGACLRCEVVWKSKGAVGLSCRVPKE